MPNHVPRGPGRDAGQRAGGRVNPLEVERYLGGAQYPMRKGDLVENVRRQGAPDDIVQAVERLPDRQFNSARAISEAMEQG